MKDVQQQYPDTCAIKVQQLILESQGFDITETELRDEAIENGWYAPDYGTPLKYVGNLLESHGVEVHRSYHSSIGDIASELSQGHPLIVAVDSGELWHDGPRETFEDIIMGENADHAVLVNGIMTNPFTAELNVLLTDPGTGDVCVEYPLEQFEDAWADSGEFLISCLI